jgi:hypothetical protein
MALNPLISGCLSYVIITGHAIAAKRGSPMSKQWVELGVRQT